MGLPPDRPEFVRFVNAVLDQVRSSGRWTELLRRVAVRAARRGCRAAGSAVRGLTTAIVTPMTDPNVQAWRSAHATLGSRLVDLESHGNVALARTGVLTGGTAAAWADADAGLAHAWETYRVLDEVLQRVEADPALAADAPDHVAGAGARRHPRRPVHGAGRGQSGRRRRGRPRRPARHRVGCARPPGRRRPRHRGERRRRGHRAGRGRTGRAGGHRSVRGGRGGRRRRRGPRRRERQPPGRRADRTGPVRRRPRRGPRPPWPSWRPTCSGAAAELGPRGQPRRRRRRPVPVADLDALAAWLDRIAAASGGDRRPRRHRPHGLDEAAPQARRAELDAAPGAARAGLQRREEGQGLWTALRAKAGARKVDEQADVAQALDAARDVAVARPLRPRRRRSRPRPPVPRPDHPAERGSNTMTAIACGRAGCSGTIADGYCDTCGMAPAKGAAAANGAGNGNGDGGTVASPSARPGTTGRTSGRVDVSRLTSRSAQTRQRHVPPQPRRRRCHRDRPDGLGRPGRRSSWPTRASRSAGASAPAATAPSAAARATSRAAPPASAPTAATGSTSRPSSGPATS